MPATFVIHRTRRGHYYFVLESSKKDILLTSDPFVFKISCLEAVDALRTASGDAAKYSEGVATNGEYFFVLRGEDGEILARSEFYAAAAWMNVARECVMHEAASAVLLEAATPS